MYVNIRDLGRDSFNSLVTYTQKDHTLMCLSKGESGRLPFLPGNRIVFVSPKLRMLAV